MSSELYIVLLICFVNIIGIQGEEVCEKIDGGAILESNCTLVKGLILKSKSGTLLNDTNCNVLLPKRVFAKEPQVKFAAAKADIHYTLVMIDPDAKSHKPGEYYLHMIKQNIPGASLAKGDISSGSDVQKYKGPGPPVGTGDHHYLFVAYEQKDANLKLEAPSDRANFKLSEWIKNVPLCGPTASVQFRTRYELEY